MIYRPQAPSNYIGTRLAICGVLGLIVTGFFLGYDAIVHRGTPSVPVQVSYREHAYPIERRSDYVKEPDMESPAVAFASADVSLPAESQSAQNPTGNFANKEAGVPQKRQLRRAGGARPVQAAHYGRPPPRSIAIARIKKEGRAAFAQGFFGLAPFGGF